MSMTANQARDAILDAVPVVTPELVRETRALAQHCETERRADQETYVKCPRCYGRHSVHGNFDNLCDKCQQIIVTHFPDHESVPFIRAALAKWKK